MILVLGGAKSGKTRWAEEKASHHSLCEDHSVVYLASAQAWDAEMTLRIQRHKESRPSEWITIEEPIAVPEAIAELKQDEKVLILFDCLTLWLTNLLMELGDDFTQIEAENHIFSRLDELIKVIHSYPGEIIIVSNLVEQGLVSPHFMGRIFQEISGKCHQRLAESADEVVHIIAGLAQRLK